MKYWFILFIAIVFEVLATSSLKLSEGFTKLIPSVLTIVAYCLSLYLLSLCLKYIPVGVAYAVWAGVGIVLITLIGWISFNQKLDLPALIGIIFIMTGVVIMNAFSKVNVY